ncbi:RNA-guided endonuclease InsQ/TnpB family protein [Desulfonema ishimotonii]|uniref:RNA-guided endonuclease InsQ/TnpB family protein n=1 Tax=Desulfonema ishimotonii TaxID=45657 RepID=UPI00140C0E64|nr:helix-turn-helix domain-containing protein [Desulfonema ishimotonii]
MTHKTELDPTNVQRGYFARACGTARFAWNRGLAEWNRQYEEGLKPSGPALKKAFNAIKKEEFPWVSDVLRDANSQPFSNLQTAFGNFFKGRAKRPHFKKKGIGDSFYIANDKFRIDENRIRIPKLGWVRMKEPFCRFGKIMGGDGFPDGGQVVCQYRRQDEYHPGNMRKPSGCRCGSGREASGDIV